MAIRAPNGCTNPDNATQARGALSFKSAEHGAQALTVGPVSCRCHVPRPAIRDSSFRGSAAELARTFSYALQRDCSSANFPRAFVKKESAALCPMHRGPDDSVVNALNIGAVLKEMPASRAYVAHDGLVPHYSSFLILLVRNDSQACFTSQVGHTASRQYSQ
jgi:hypothetical protein